MNLETIVQLVNGVIVTDNHFKGEIEYGLTSDLMSDILTLDMENAVLITGLCNVQTIRTAEMSDISCVLVARNKKVNSEMIDLANQNEIVIVESSYGVFKISGILFANNIKPAY